MLVGIKQSQAMIGKQTQPCSCRLGRHETPKASAEPIRMDQQSSPPHRRRQHWRAGLYSSANDVQQFYSLEPISKSFEKDNEAGELDKAEEIVGVVFPANKDAALPLNPGEEALDEPAAHVAA
jgi:hypothetical protein